MWVKIAAIAFALTLLAYLAWLSYIIRGYSAKYEVEAADVILVLGSRPKPNGEPTRMLLGRVQHGVELYRQGQAPWLMFVGGEVHNLPNQSEVMARTASEMGVPEEALLLEGQSRTTLEGVRLSKKLMVQRGFKSALVVSSPFHMARALRMYRDAGVTVYGSPALHSEEGLIRTFSLWLWIREWGAFTLYFLSLSP